MFIHIGIVPDICDTIPMNEMSALTFCEETIKLKESIEKDYISLCARLYKIREERLYEGQYSDWQVFLEELKITPSVASRLCKIWEVFIVNFDIDKKELQEAGGWTIAAEILKVATTKKTAEELLSLAKLYTRAHLRQHIQKLLKGAPEDCKHKNTITIKVCEDCGYKFREYAP